MSWFRFSLSAFAFALAIAPTLKAQLTSPQLTSITRTSASSLTAGVPVSYTFGVTVGQGDTLTSIVVIFEDAFGNTKQLNTNGLSGALATDSTWLNGAYAVKYVSVSTAATGRNDFNRSGTVVHFNSAVTNPTTHTVPFSQADFTLTGGLSSLTSPQLTSITRTSASSLTAGAPVGYTFGVTVGQGDTLTSIVVIFEDAFGNTKQLNTNSLSGALATDSTWLNGAYTVKYISVSTAATGRNDFNRSGTVVHFNSAITTPTTHNVSFAASDFAITEGITTAPAAITSQPVSTTANAGQSVTLSLTATGSPTPTIQWFKDGKAINAATNSALTFASVFGGDAGTYTATVSNVYNGSTYTLTTAPAVLTVITTPPTITTQPVSQTVLAGGNVTFSITATGSEPMLYRWYRDGVEISGATNSSLTINGVQPSDAGGYRVIIGNWANQIRAVSSGGNYTMFLGADGTLWGMGFNGYGQLGDGTTTTRTSPVQVASRVASVSVGDGHTMFLKTDGSLWAMGSNSNGRLGDGTTINRVIPFQAASGVVKVSAGLSHTMFLVADGTLWGMGANGYGQLGDGTTTNRFTPVQVAIGVTDVASKNHTMFLKADGSLWGTGFNSNGHLGDGTTTNRVTPFQVASRVASVAVGDGHTMFLKTDGSLWGAGFNGNGQLGDGTTTTRTSPVQVASRVASVSAGGAHTMFVKTDGTLWATGYNDSGQLGDGSTTSRSTPVQVASEVVSVSSSSERTMFIKMDGSLWGMGKNEWGLLGDSTATNRTTPIRLAGGLQSAPAALTVQTAPLITTHPVSQTITVGLPLNLAVVATGIPAPTYQWRKSGTNIPNATNASYTINSATTGDAGAYTAVVTNTVSTMTSTEAVVTVNPAAPAAITVQPTNVTANIGQSATLSVTVSGMPAPVIQWLKNSTVISGATNATYTISSVSQSDAATYSATVQNVYNGTTYSLTTSPAVLTVGFVTGDGFACTSDGSVIKITGYTGTATALTVPGTISGLPVTGLGASALQGKSLTSVSLPPSLVSIGSLAFGANPALSQIALPANLVSIGASAFIGCGLTSVLIPASVTSIGVETFVNNTLLGAINVEAGNPNYASVEGVLFDKNIVTLLQYPASRSGAYTIPTSVTTIGRSAFDRVASLTEITIPVGLTKLDTNAFFRCTSLKTVSIPSTVTSISVQPFAGCYSLTSINVDAANPKYAGVGGVLFDKALTTLIQFPGGLAGAYTIPTGVTKIGNGSFRGSALTQVFVPAGVATMEWGAFIESSNLQEIVFLGNAPTLVTPAVPSTLKRVYYLSTASGWTATFNGIATSPIPAPSIVTQPQNQTVARGATATFSVAISSVPAPTYQWYFNGSLAIAGATNASFSVPSAQVANQGPYNVRASTAAGEITSASATLTVNVPPVIATAPGNVTIPNGERTQLKVSASGANPLSYQWYQGSSGNISNPMAGATGATFTTAGLTATTSYWVRITDANGLTTDSPSATVTVSASSPLTVTQQVITAGYRSGEAVVVTNTITYTGTAPSRIDWSTLLPAGWKYLGSGGSEGGGRPPYESGDLLEWSWTTVPASPIKFTYMVSVPAGTTGDQVIASLVTSQAAGTNYQTMAKPDPLVIRSASLHSADSNRDGKISLTELTRVIELYNYRSGTTRTGQYKPQAGSEDGFTPGP